MDFPIQPRDDSPDLPNPPDLPDRRTGDGNHTSTCSSSSSFAQIFSSPLTAIKGNAQLIRRRVKGLDDHDALALERSVVAIERAVERIVIELAVASDIPLTGASEKPDEQG